jgi:hypothetical protein
MRKETVRALSAATKTMRDSFLLTAVGLEGGALILGDLWGREVGYPGRPPSVYTVYAHVASVLMLIGAFLSFLNRLKPRVKYSRAAVCAGSFLYGLGLVRFEPLLIHDETDVVVAYVVLIPLLVAAGYLLKVHAWISVAGITLFVFTSSAMITSNINVRDAGSGFHVWWRGS